jgi:hypothetical protein
MELRWLLLAFVGSQIFLYAARVPLHRALGILGQMLSGGFRLKSRWLKGMATDLSTRAHELSMEAGRENAHKKVEHEFRRLEEVYGSQLRDFPHVQRKLDDLATKLDADYKECGVSPPAAPGWAVAIESIAKASEGKESMVKKVLNEFQKNAIETEKAALTVYRKTTLERHQILGTMQPPLKQIQLGLQEAVKRCKAVLDATQRIDGCLERYAKLRENEPGLSRVQTWAAVNAFVIAALVTGVALGGAFINFQLISLPMSELVPSGGRLMGMSVSSIAALVLVLMEAAAGIFLMEMLGITSLFPQLLGLPASRRRLVMLVSLAGLFLLACIESSLAILREQIVVSEAALKQSLSGSAAGAAVEGLGGSRLPVIGQAVLGFVLPWILAMVAIPLEVMIRNGATVGLVLTSLVVAAAGHIVRLIGALLRYVMQAIRYLYDVYIIIPLWIERMVHHKPMMGVIKGARQVPNPVARGGKQEVVS